MRQRVCLISYDVNDNKVSEQTVSGLDLPSAATEAVLLGIEAGGNFHVQEVEGTPTLYWSGRPTDDDRLPKHKDPEEQTLLRYEAVKAIIRERMART